MRRPLLWIAVRRNGDPLQFVGEIATFTDPVFPFEEKRGVGTEAGRVKRLALSPRTFDFWNSEH
jgi:hypothetical protein